MRAVIVANGPSPEAPFPAFQVEPDDLVICVDGGARNALDLGLRPDVVIGDMDSLGSELSARLQESVRLVTYPPRKDQTDLELAVRYALDEGATDLVLLAALGGRIDHTLANVMLLAMPELQGIRARLVDGPQELLLVRDKVVIEGRPGDTVSLLPLTKDAVGIYTQGLEYALKEGVLKFGAARGVSNVMKAEQATVRVSDGLLLVVHHHQQGLEGTPLHGEGG
jgi:thiamine pyrophosphokinase